MSSLTGKVFGIAFILVILLGSIVAIGVMMNKPPTDAAYYVAGSTLNSTQQTLDAWTAPQLQILGAVAVLAIVFVLCIVFLMAVLRKKRY
jgi:hypothetical protein